MSRGHGRVEETVLRHVTGSRYGCTVRELAWAAYPGTDEPTQSQLASVRRAVDRLIAEGRLREQTDYYGECRLRDTAPEPRDLPRTRRRVRSVPATQALRCVPCDVQWSLDGPGTRDCWSCGRPGTPAAAESV